MENGKQPAFGYGFTTADGQSHVNESGLTKREYFAGLAMQGLLSNPEWMREYKGEKYLIEKDIAIKESIKYADELLKQLNN